MNKFTQHVPNCVDIDRDRWVSFEFETLEELVNHPFVKRFSSPKKPDFSHFAIHNTYLMAIYDDGFKWWVLGSVATSEGLDLPKWQGWKFRALLDEQEIVLSGKDVVSSCGDRLELRDGRVATNLRK